MEPGSMKPSDFAAMGKPSCSCWGKSETEWVALAYVQALAATGDTWRRMTRDEVAAALTPEQLRHAYEPHFTEDRYLYRFNAVADRIVDEEGAWSVGGFWNPHRMDRIRSADSGDGK